MVNVLTNNIIESKKSITRGVKNIKVAYQCHIINIIYPSITFMRVDKTRPTTVNISRKQYETKLLVFVKPQKSGTQCRSYRSLESSQIYWSSSPGGGTGAKSASTTAFCLPYLSPGTHPSIELRKLKLQKKPALTTVQRYTPALFLRVVTLNFDLLTPK